MSLKRFLCTYLGLFGFIYTSMEVYAERTWRMRYGKRTKNEEEKKYLIDSNDKSDLRQQSSCF